MSENDEKVEYSQDYLENFGAYGFHGNDPNGRDEEGCRIRRRRLNKTKMGGRK